MAKHDWNSLQHFLEIHDKTLRMYQRYMETPRVYTHKEETPLHHKLICHRVFFTTYKGTRVRVDIAKDIEVNLDNPRRPQARTFWYSYSANLPGGTKLIRYCSPHDEWEEEGSAPHHTRHHKHDFRKNPKGEITLLGNDDWPHVGEFLEEILSSF